MSLRDPSALGIWWMLALVLVVSCGQAPAPAAELDPIAVARLHEYLVTKQRPVFAERLGDERLWTDSALLERTTQPPPSIQKLLDGPSPGGGPRPGSMAELLQDLERHRSEWRIASVHRRGTGNLDCAIGDGVVSAEVNCVYVNYLQARYAEGQFAVKAPLEPVLFLERGQVRAALMPMQH